MSTFSFEAEVFSPRWGHTDSYSLTFNDSSFVLNLGIKRAVCDIDVNGNETWSGHHAMSGNPIHAIFQDDSIQAPEVIPRNIRWAWDQWKEGTVTEDELREGLSELFAWIDSVARSKPNGKLWSGFF